jgi:hypothetical protein
VGIIHSVQSAAPLYAMLPSHKSCRSIVRACLPPGLSAWVPGCLSGMSVSSVCLGSWLLSCLSAWLAACLSLQGAC